MQDLIARLRAKKDDDGFTLIELLVVVVIIGVLVAIAVPVYLNYRQGAADKSAQSDVRGAISTVEQWYTDNANTYPLGPSGVPEKFSFNLSATAVTAAATAASTTAAGLITLSDKTELVYVAPAGTTLTYRICGHNVGGSGKYYVYDSATGGSVKATTAITDNATFIKCGA
ncbi:prepilin-type N-terminal cleavage/methylation domain-containing protein [Micromonosporaceae bacterium Da 78-11]